MRSHFSGTRWVSSLSLMSPMTKAFWPLGITSVHHACRIDQKTWCPKNRRMEWFLRPSCYPGTGWTSWQHMPIQPPQTLSSVETRCFSQATRILRMDCLVLNKCHQKLTLALSPYFHVNQVDLEGLRTVSSDRGRAMAAELGLPYFETSAATGQGPQQLVFLPLSWFINFLCVPAFEPGWENNSRIFAEIF